MSTSITEINGHHQIPGKNHLKIIWQDSKLHLNRFYGGIEKGTMLQLTIIEGNSDYIMLTQNQVKELIKHLNEAFDYNKHPSE